MSQEKLLFISNGHIGDVVLTSGIFNYFVSNHPNAQITVVTAPVVAHLFEDIPQVANIIPIKKMPYRRHWLKIYQQTSNQNWSIIINMRNSGLSYLLKAKKRYDFIWKKPFSGEHVILEKQKQFGLKEFPWPHIHIKESREKKLLADITRQKDIIAIAPFTRWPNKCWPHERFVQLIQQLTAQTGFFPGASVAIFGGQGDRTQLNYFQDALKDQVIDLVDNGHLLDKAAWIKQCKLYIGNDAGGVHMAAAVNCPTIALFGPTDAKRYRPMGKQSCFVQTDVPYDTLIEEANLNAMDSLPVDKVYKSIQNLLNIKDK